MRTRWYEETHDHEMSRPNLERRSAAGLITHGLYTIADRERLNRPGQLRASFCFKNLPCLDYPLLITDKSTVS